MEKPSKEFLDSLGVRSWPIWEKEVSSFPWHYESTEQCYILEGKVKVRAGEAEVSFQQGDFVTFPEGLSCYWEVEEPVRKHYRFL